MLAQQPQIVKKSSNIQTFPPCESENNVLTRLEEG